MVHLSTIIALIIIAWFFWAEYQDATICDRKLESYQNMSAHMKRVVKRCEIPLGKEGYVSHYKISTAVDAFSRVKSWEVIIKDQENRNRVNCRGSVDTLFSGRTLENKIRLGSALPEDWKIVQCLSSKQIDDMCNNLYKVAQCHDERKADKIAIEKNLINYQAK